MNSLRNKLILVFVIATLAPLLVTVRLSVLLIQRSLSYSTVHELDTVSKSLQITGHELYQQAQEDLRREAASAHKPDAIYPVKSRPDFEPGTKDQFVLSGPGGSRLDYLVRHGDQLWVWSRSLNGARLHDFETQFRDARATVEDAQSRDLQRGLTYTLIVLAAAIWAISLIAVTYLAHRLSRPIRKLTDGLSAVAAGNLEHRVQPGRGDEVGSAIAAFNNMADQLQHSRERLVYMTRLETWQALARKMAHEIKNSLTPIRLTMEEIAARFEAIDESGFVLQATQIVVDEVTGLERRVHAFRELGSEPPVRIRPVDVNHLLEERISFLKSAHPGVHYDVKLDQQQPTALADEDLIRGVLTNLLENAAQAGRDVLGVTAVEQGRVKIEVHDSGPGLSAAAKSTLFEPTISFKPGGMGLGLSIARKSTVLSGGEIELVDSCLGGAGFRILLPTA